MRLNSKSLILLNSILWALDKRVTKGAQKLLLLRVVFCIAKIALFNQKNFAGHLHKIFCFEKRVVKR